ncbi:hypothetical protein EDD18DRAFT_158782 [Armillaria luteobubalina]|uniref:Uncharacterized protein n=1 Tax=Armillaria luteobubalina TaxID=153913 RepID=A0AA39Q852_9AGAR|nr:hypothetical protein EDD18DRAFT_158782 [Armillaria luteobubalina]
MHQQSRILTKGTLALLWILLKQNTLSIRELSGDGQSDLRQSPNLCDRLKEKYLDVILDRVSSLHNEKSCSHTEGTPPLHR